MQYDKIEELREAFPDIFDVKKIPGDWLDDVHVIDRYDNYPDPFEDELFPDSENPVADMPDRIIPIDDDEQELPDLDDLLDDADVLTETNGRLRERLGDDFPGAPSDTITGRVPVIEVYGFYLPWHKFDQDKWGIYIFAEGIVSLGKYFNALSKYRLPIKECNLLARAFIFHHEAYHNKVESFSARLEVVLRSPIFNGATCKLYQSKGFPVFPSPLLTLPLSGLFHEESLANAYAARMCRKVFSNYPKHQKKNLQNLACSLIYKFIKTSPPKYRDAVNIVLNPWRYRDTLAASDKRFDAVESEFNEEILKNSTHHGHSNPMLWNTQTKLMDPTLRRNASFSYLINKKSKLAKRLKLAVHYIPRRKLIKYMEKLIGGHEEITGGKHPRKFISGNMRIPVPGNKNQEINMQTAKKILKQFGIFKSDTELLRDL